MAPEPDCPVLVQPVRTKTTTNPIIAATITTNPRMGRILDFPLGAGACPAAIPAGGGVLAVGWMPGADGERPGLAERPSLTMV